MKPQQMIFKLINERAKRLLIGCLKKTAETSFSNYSVYIEEHKVMTSQIYSYILK